MDDSTVLSPATDVAIHFQNAENSLARFRLESADVDLQGAIESFRCAHDLVRLENDAFRRRIQTELAMVLYIRFSETGHDNDLHESISLAKDAVNRSVGAEDEDRARCLRVLGHSLTLWWMNMPQAAGNAIVDAIRLLREAVSLTEGMEDNERIACLNSYGFSLFCAPTNIEGALGSALTALNESRILASKGHYLWMEATRRTCNVLMNMFTTTRERTHLDMAISLATECVDIMPVRHYGRKSLLNTLAFNHLQRYDHFGQSEDLDCAIELFGQLAGDTPDHHGAWHIVHGNYFNAIKRRYFARSQLPDLDLAINGLRQVVDRLRLGNELSNSYIMHLCEALEEGFTQYGRTRYLDDAIEIQRKAIHAIEFVDESGCHRALGRSYLSRFRAHGYERDLDKAVMQLEEAVRSCRTESHKASFMADLGDVLSARFHITQDPDNINRAIQAFQYALEHSDKQNLPVLGRYQSWLGSALLLRFNFVQDNEDLLSAIAVLTGAVRVLPREDTHCAVTFSRLGVARTHQFGLSGDEESIRGAVDSFERAVSLTPKGRPSRAMYTAQLGEASYILSAHVPAVDKLTALAYMKAAAEDQSSFAADRFHAATRWSTLAYDSGHLPAALDGYRLAVELLPQVAWLGLEHDLRLKRLTTQSHNLCQNGAACAIALGELEVAVEMLDRGRSVIWNSSQNFRIDLGDLRAKHPDLARAFQEVGLALDYRALSSEQRSQLSQEHDGQHHRRLADQWQELLDKIRNQEGFTDFLKPASFSELRLAARGGVIVLLNLSEHRCDALLVTEHFPIHLVPLPKVELSHMRQQAYVLASARRVARDSRGQQFLEAVLLMILRSLWSVIGEPVWEAIKSLDPRDCTKRIWWCPTGALTQLPLHACGPYDDEHLGMADVIISSYTPTLSALLRAKTLQNPLHSSLPAVQFRMLGIGQSNTPGQPALPCADEEMDVLRSISFPQPISIVEAGDATVDRVCQLMTSHSWLHIATHGVQRANAPLESCLQLFDGALHLSTIAQANLPDAVFAFLSACHAAKGDQSLPDESLHLAGGLLLAGYKGVLATQWSIADKDAPNVARSFYSHLTRGGKIPDPREAAEALHTAISVLRQASVPAIRWVPFVHLGV